MVQFIEIAGHKLETSWHGPKPTEAPTLIFLHEGLGCIAMWKQFPQQLADAVGCGALIYSRAGYGASSECVLPRPIDFMRIEGCEVLPQLIEAYDINEFFLIGHSDGASISLIYSGHLPDPGLQGLIVEAPHLFTEPTGLESIAEARQAYLDGDLRERLSMYHPTNVDTAFWGWNDVWLNPDFEQWNINDYVSEIQTPVLTLQGKQDQYGTLQQVKAIESLTQSEVTTVLLDNCAHTPHREQMEKTLSTMSDFILKQLAKSKPN